MRAVLTVVDTTLLYVVLHNGRRVFGGDVDVTDTFALNDVIRKLAHYGLRLSLSDIKEAIQTAYASPLSVN